MQLTLNQVEDTLDLHGVATHRDARGILWAREEATVPDPSGGWADATAWVQVPHDVAGLKAWLGY